MIKVNIDLEIMCDVCGNSIKNHYPIAVFDSNIEDELDTLAELNNFNLDGEMALCPECEAVK